MADTTPTYGFPFLELGDPPDLAAGTEDLATAVEAKIVTVDATTTSLDSRLDVLEALGIQIVRKTADTARSTATAAADPHLTFNASANANYRVRAMLFFVVEGGNSSVDIKAGFSQPASSLITYGITGPDIAIAGSAGAGVAQTMWQAYVDQSGNSTAEVGVSNHGTLATPVILDGIVRLGATAGAVAVMWAQRTASANQLHLRPNSYLEIMRVS